MIFLCRVLLVENYCWYSRASTIINIDWHLKNVIWAVEPYNVGKACLQPWSILLLLVTSSFISTYGYSNKFSCKIKKTHILWRIWLAFGCLPAFGSSNLLLVLPFSCFFSFLPFFSSFSDCEGKGWYIAKKDDFNQEMACKAPVEILRNE